MIEIVMEPFIYHRLDFTLTAPEGLARCRRCEQLVSLEGYLSLQCPGGAVSAPAPIPARDEVDCALCGRPVLVASLYRDHVRWAGTTCDACFYDVGLAA